MWQLNCFDFFDPSDSESPQDKDEEMWINILKEMICWVNGSQKVVFSVSFENDSFPKHTSTQEKGPCFKKWLSCKTYTVQIQILLFLKETLHNKLK